MSLRAHDLFYGCKLGVTVYKTMVASMVELSNSLVIDTRPMGALERDPVDFFETGYADGQRTHRII